MKKEDFATITMTADHGFKVGDLIEIQMTTYQMRGRVVSVKDTVLEFEPIRWYHIWWWRISGCARAFITWWRENFKWI